MTDGWLGLISQKQMKHQKPKNQKTYMKRERLPTQAKSKKKLCLRCSKRTFVINKGCPNCGYIKVDDRIVTRQQVREQLRK